MVEDFRSYFRLSRGTVGRIVQQLGTLPGFVQAGDCPGRERVPVEKQLLVAIWLLGNQETFRSVCDRFDLARSTTHVIFKKVCNALCSELLFHASDRMFKTREKRQTRKNAQKIHRHPIFAQRFLCTYVKRTSHPLLLLLATSAHVNRFWFNKPALSWFIDRNRNCIPIPVYAKRTCIPTLVYIPKPE